MTGRTVIVTGGTRGIGLALAEGFALAGANVVVASRKPDACEQAAEHLRGLGGAAIGVPAHSTTSPVSSSSSLVRNLNWSSPRRSWLSPGTSRYQRVSRKIALPTVCCACTSGTE